MQLANLLQSKQWEEFQNSLGKKTFWIENSLLIKNELPLGKNYLYCPHGPEELTKEFIERVKKLAKQACSPKRREKTIFVRIEPLQENKKTCLAGPPVGGQAGKAKKQKIKKTKSIQPSSTLILNLEKSEEQLLSEMKPKTRYNIRLAQRKRVTIETTIDPEKIDIFYNILTETTARDRFHAHPLSYYKKMLEILGKQGIIKLYLAKYENKYIAANIVSFYKNTATYLHGASSNQYRNVMAPHLLQWQAICDAKKQGLKYYDFWGIADTDNLKHKWSGVTRFKKGFGGEAIHYPGTYDVVISKTWYFIYKIMRFVNRIKNF